MAASRDRLYSGLDGALFVFSLQEDINTDAMPGLKRWFELSSSKWAECLQQARRRRHYLMPKAPAVLRRRDGPSLSTEL